MHDPTRSFSIGDVKGRNVIDANGDNVGTISDVVVDPQSWKVSGFVVALRRDMAQRFQLRSGYFDAATVEVGADRVKTVGDNVILNIDASVIGEALGRRDETFRRSDEPYAPERDATYAGAPLGSTSVDPPYEPPRF